MFFLASSHIFHSYLHVFVHDQKNAFEQWASTTISIISSIIITVVIGLWVCCARVWRMAVRHARTHIQFFSSQLCNTLRTFLANLFGFFSLPSDNCFRHRCCHRRRRHRFFYILIYMYLFVVFTLVALLTCYHCHFSFDLPVWWKILIYLLSFALSSLFGRKWNIHFQQIPRIPFQLRSHGIEITNFSFLILFLFRCESHHKREN